MSPPCADWAGDIQRPEGLRHTGSKPSVATTKDHPRLVHTDVREIGMKLSWFRRSKIIVEVLDDEILVTMPGTSFSVVYDDEQSAHRQLLFWKESAGRKKHGELPTLSFTCLDSGKREGEGDRLDSLGRAN